MINLSTLLQHLLGLPLTWLFLTLCLFLAHQHLYQRLNAYPLANPTAWTILDLMVLLGLTHTPYFTYFEGGRWIHLLLGPATVSLAIPLYNNLPKLRSALTPLLLTLVVASVLGVISGAGLAWILGLPREIIISLAPRSITTPIAMSVAEVIGGSASMAAAFVVITGLLGAILVKPVLRLFRLDQPAVLGFATGLAAHGLGTARAFGISNVAGAFGALAMGLNGALTAIWLPIIMHYLV